MEALFVLSLNSAMNPLREQLEQADNDFRQAIRREMPDAEAEHISTILQRLEEEYSRRYWEILDAHMGDDARLPE